MRDQPSPRLATAQAVAQLEQRGAASYLGLLEPSRRAEPCTCSSRLPPVSQRGPGTTSRSSRRVIVALITEPLPGPVVGILGITAAAALGLVTPAPDDAIRWTLSGFSHSTVWLIFVAFCLIWKFSRILG